MNRTQKPFAESASAILRERGISGRGLADQVGVHYTHMAKLLRGAKPPSQHVLQAVTLALELPPDYFCELREFLIAEAVRADPDLRDRLYDQISSCRRSGR